MTVPLRVLGDRVLVKPDVNLNAPETLASGVVVAKSLAAAVTGEDATISICRGTVIAVGTPKHPLHHEVESLAKRLEQGPPFTDLMDAAHLLRDLIRRQPCVAGGDDVLFSHDAGQETIVDSDTYVILHEHELLAVVVPESASAPVEFTHIGFGLRENNTIGEL